jgi:hypothetical protein
MRGALAEFDAEPGAPPSDTPSTMECWVQRILLQSIARTPKRVVGPAPGLMECGFKDRVLSAWL